MEKQTVGNKRYIDLLNEEIKLHPFFKEGMEFMPAPPAFPGSLFVGLTWDKNRWAEYDYVFAAASRVMRQRYRVK
jgi:hypothetical protein